MFDGTLGYWNTYHVDLELRPDYKSLNRKYYPVSLINRYNFHKELERSVKIGGLTKIQQSQYGTPVFTIPNKEGAVGFITDYLRLNQKLVNKTYL